ncbi:hypothetical protein Vafri_8341 [Volvox africanus]|nr:hypothetical protein Vafri_8341 [Volvox africanus]
MPPPTLATDYHRKASSSAPSTAGDATGSCDRHADVTMQDASPAVFGDGDIAAAAKAAAAAAAARAAAHKAPLCPSPPAPSPSQPLLPASVASVAGKSLHSQHHQRMVGNTAAATESVAASPAANRPQAVTKANPVCRDQPSPPFSVSVTPKSTPQHLPSSRPGAAVTAAATAARPTGPTVAVALAPNTPSRASPCCEGPTHQQQQQQQQQKQQQQQVRQGVMKRIEQACAPGGINAAVAAAAAAAAAVAGPAARQGAVALPGSKAGGGVTAEYSSRGGGGFPTQGSGAYIPRAAAAVTAGTTAAVTAAVTGDVDGTKPSKGASGPPPFGASGQQSGSASAGKGNTHLIAAAAAAATAAQRRSPQTAATTAAAAAAAAAALRRAGCDVAEADPNIELPGGSDMCGAAISHAATVKVDDDGERVTNLRCWPRASAAVATAAAAGIDADGAMAVHGTSGEVSANLPALLAEWHLGQRAARSADVRQRTTSLPYPIARNNSAGGAAAAVIRTIAQDGAGGGGTATATATASETRASAKVVPDAGQVAPAPPWQALGRGPRNRSTRYKGVSLYRRTGRYEAHIWHEGRQLHIGTYKTDVEAALAYDRVSRYLRGPAAVLNFPDEASAAAAAAVEAAVGDVFAADGALGGDGGLVKSSNAAASGGAMKAAAAPPPPPRHQHGPVSEAPLTRPADVRRFPLAGLKGQAAAVVQPLLAAAENNAIRGDGGGGDGGGGDGGGGGLSAIRAAGSDAPLGSPRGGLTSGRGGGGSGRGTSVLVKPWPSSLAVSKSKASGGATGGGEGGENIGTAVAAAAAAAVRSVRRRISAVEPSSAPHFQLPRSALVRAASSHELRTSTAAAAAALAAAAATAAAGAAAAAAVSSSPRGSGGGGGSGGSGVDGTAAAPRSQPTRVDKPLREPQSRDNAGDVADGRLSEATMDRVESWMRWQASATGASSPPASATCIGSGGGGHGGDLHAAAALDDQTAVAATTGNGRSNNQPVLENHRNKPLPPLAPLQPPPPPSTPLNRNCSAGSSSYSCSYECGHGAHAAMQTAATGGSCWAGEVGRGSCEGSGLAVHGGSSGAAPDHALMLNGGDAWAVVGVANRTQPRVLPGGVLDLAPPLWPLQLPLPLEPLLSVPPTQAAAPIAAAELSSFEAGRQGDRAVSGSGRGFPDGRAENGSQGVSSYGCGLVDGAAAPHSPDGDAADTAMADAFLPNPFIELEANAGTGGTEEPEALLTPVPQQQQKQRQNTSRPSVRDGGDDGRGGGSHKRAVGSAALQALLSAGVPPQLLRALLAHSTAAGNGSSCDESYCRDAHGDGMVAVPPSSSDEHAHAAAPHSHLSGQTAAGLGLSCPAAPASLDVARGETQWHQKQAMLPLLAQQMQLEKVLPPTSNLHPAAHRPPHSNPYGHDHPTQHPQPQQPLMRQQSLPHAEQPPAPDQVSRVAASPLTSAPAPAPAPALAPTPHMRKDAAVASILRHLARPTPSPLAVHHTPQSTPAPLQSPMPPATATATTAAAVSNLTVYRGNDCVSLSSDNVGDRSEQGRYPPHADGMLQQGAIISASTCGDSTLPPRPGPAADADFLEELLVRPPAERSSLAPPFLQTPPARTVHGFGAAPPAVPQPVDSSTAAGEDVGAGKATGPQPSAASSGGGEGSSNRLFWVGGQLHGLGGALLDFLHAPPVTASSIRSLLLSQRHQQQESTGGGGNGNGNGSSSCLNSKGGFSAPDGVTAAGEAHAHPAVGAGANLALLADYAADDACAVVRPGAPPAGACRPSAASSQLWAMGTRPELWLGAFDIGDNAQVNVGAGGSAVTVQRSLTVPSPSSPPPIDPSDIGGRGGAVQRSLTVPSPSSPPMAKLPPFPGPYKRPREDSSGSISGVGAVAAPDGAVAAAGNHAASAASLVADITDCDNPGSGAVLMCIDHPTDGVRSATNMAAEHELGRGLGTGGSGSGNGNGSEGLPSAASQPDGDGRCYGGRVGGGVGNGWRRGEGSAAAMRTHPDKKTRLLYGVYGVGGSGGAGCGEAPA